MMTRRRLFQLGGAAALAWPLRRLARATGGATAKRLIVVYFPDGVIGASQSGDASLWDAGGSDTGYTLPSPLLSPLAPYRDRLVAFRGLSMGPTDAGSHPGGAKKLLTATDGGNGVSLDNRLASTIGAGDPFHSLYLGAQANANNPSGDMYVSYVAPGVHDAARGRSDGRVRARVRDARGQRQRRRRRQRRPAPEERARQRGDGDRRAQARHRQRRRGHEARSAPRRRCARSRCACRRWRRAGVVQRAVDRRRRHLEQHAVRNRSCSRRS